MSERRAFASLQRSQPNPTRCSNLPSALLKSISTTANTCLEFDSRNLSHHPTRSDTMTIALNTLSRDSAHVPYTKPTPANASSYQPTHPGLLKVVLQQGKGSDGEDTYSSYLIAEQVSLPLLFLARQVLILLVFFQDFPANTVITQVTNLTPGTKAYSSVQHGNGEHDHFELNSDLLFGKSEV